MSQKDPILSHTKHLDKLVEVMKVLRSPEGCPWDRKQTTQSLVPYAIEETAEFMESAEDLDVEGMKEELGDMLMHIVLHSVIAEENGWFTIEDVIDGIVKKMVRRHPHVFGDQPKVDSAEEIPGLWEQIKKTEKPTEFKSVLGKYPRHYPALLRAQKIKEKASKVGFDWTNITGVKEKVLEEWNELLEALESDDQAHIDEEFGDVLFVLMCMVSHGSQVPAEVLLRQACEKFERRFHFIEKFLIANGQNIHETPLDELESLWQAAKKTEKQ